MSIRLKNFVEVPEFDNANEMLGWLIAQWKEALLATRCFVIMDKTDLTSIVHAYDDMVGKVYQNWWSESKESKDKSTNNSDL